MSLADFSSVIPHHACQRSFHLFSHHCAAGHNPALETSCFCKKRTETAQPARRWPPVATPERRTSCQCGSSQDVAEGLSARTFHSTDSVYPWNIKFKDLPTRLTLLRARASWHDPRRPSKALQAWICHNGRLDERKNLANKKRKRNCLVQTQVQRAHSLAPQN